MPNITVSNDVHLFMQAGNAGLARDVLGVPATGHSHTVEDIDSNPAIDGYVLTADGIGGAAWEAIPHYGILGITIDGAGSVITTGNKGYLRVPYNCIITDAEIVADQSGSIVIDVWKDSYANFPPTDADSITASAPPTLSSAQKSRDATLTGWTTSLSAGDYLAFNVDSASTVTRVTLSLKVTRS